LVKEYPRYIEVTRHYTMEIASNTAAVEFTIEGTILVFVVDRMAANLVVEVACTVISSAADTYFIIREDTAADTRDFGANMVTTTVEHKVTATRDRQVVGPKVVPSTSLKLAGVAVHTVAFTTFVVTEFED
jgi:hypothetical protein